MTDVRTAEAQGQAHDAAALVINEADIGTLERALSEARARQDATLPQRALDGLVAKRAKFQALLDATDQQIELAKAGEL